ncbi:DNA-binding protein [Pigmentiphaga soli]|uniref:DNA-binding protein n=1 Tax=Pigmentiphaga soli TaxID=1007095 RepID=A0ABP8GLP9_9BURK
MRTKLLNDDAERTFAVILETGDEAVSSLETFARENAITAARFTAIGAFRRATLGYFDWQSKEYERIELDEQAEVLSLVGDIALQDGRAKLHAHAVLGRRDGGTRGGHLLEAIVRPTLEVLLTDSPAYLKREFDPEAGLPLIKLRG